MKPNSKGIEFSGVVESDLGPGHSELPKSRGSALELQFFAFRLLKGSESTPSNLKALRQRELVQPSLGCFWQFLSRRALRLSLGFGRSVMRMRRSIARLRALDEPDSMVPLKSRFNKS